MEEKYQQPNDMSIEQQLNKIADTIKTYISMSCAVISMNVKSMIFPPDLKQSNIGSSTLAMAEIFLKVQNSNPEEENCFTIIVFFDTGKPLKFEFNKSIELWLPSDIKILKFHAELPCQLSKLVSDYILPKPNQFFSINYEEYVKPIPFVNLPAIQGDQYGLVLILNNYCAFDRVAFLSHNTLK